MMKINEFENSHIEEWEDVDRFLKAIELYFQKNLIQSFLQVVNHLITLLKLLKEMF